MEARPNTFQRRRFASQTKPIQECHPERSEGSLAGQRSFAALRMTKRDGLFFERYCPQGVPGYLSQGFFGSVPMWNPAGTLMSHIEPDTWEGGMSISES